MSENTRRNIKRYFEDGDRPTQQHFSELIDSFINKLDDEIFIVVPAGLHEKRVGIGTGNPKARLDVDGGIKVGNTRDAFSGIIRWTGSDFEGYDGHAWRSLTRDVAATREIHIPELRIECTADRLYAFWEDCTDKRFLQHRPQIWIYRYKSRIKQTYKDRSKRTRIRPKKWAHTSNLDSRSHNNPRQTEFQLTPVPGAKQFINMEPIKWFKPIPNDTPNNFRIPRGQGVNPIPEKPFFNRRFEYFRLRIVLTVEGKKIFGPFSETFSLSYRRRYYSNKSLKRYKPVFELAQPSHGMTRPTNNNNTAGSVNLNTDIKDLIDQLSDTKLSRKERYAIFRKVFKKK